LLKLGLLNVGSNTTLIAKDVNYASFDIIKSCCTLIIKICFKVKLWLYYFTKKSIKVKLLLYSME